MSEELTPHNPEHTHAELTNITEIMQTAYIDYSMSVIVSRALPDAAQADVPIDRLVSKMPLFGSGKIIYYTCFKKGSKPCCA